MKTLLMALTLAAGCGSLEPDDARRRPPKHGADMSPIVVQQTPCDADCVIVGTPVTVSDLGVIVNDLSGGF